MVRQLHHGDTLRNELNVTAMGDILALRSYVMLCYVMLCYVMLCYVMMRNGPADSNRKK